MSILQRFHERGFLTVKGVMDAGFIDLLREEYLRQFESVTEGGAPDLGLEVGGARFMLSVQMKGPFLDPTLYANPVLLGITSALLGKDFVIDSLMCVSAFPGADLQHLHVDHPNLFPERAELRAQLLPYAVTLAVPLVDLTPATGTTMVYPGSHLGDANVEPQRPYLDRGDALLFDFRLWHQGTPNQGREQRPVIYITYVRRWFVDFRNFGRQGRIVIDEADLPRIAVEHRPLFMRLAAKGAFDLTEPELFG